MKNSILWFCRIFVGALFIFSGLIKANDPVGFGIKLDEYYEVFADKWQWTAFLFKAEWLLNSTTQQAAFLTTLEIALGIGLLLGIMRNLVAWLLLLMMVFFTWLTGFSAITGSVTDCGCFGDAIPLTPLQSFYKDLILTALILVIFFMRKRIKPLFHAAPSSIIFLIVTGFGLWVAVHSIRHDVFLDFRPYAVGNNIPELMKLPENPKPSVIEMNYIYKKKSDGSLKEVKMVSGRENSKEVMTELSSMSGNPEWEFVERKDKVIEKGDMAKINDFAVMDENNEDITGEVLGNPDYQIMIVSAHIDQTNTGAWTAIKEVQQQAEAERLPVFVLAGSARSDIEKFRHENQTAFPFYTGDYKVCLTIARTNPAIVLLKEGTVMDKWSWRDLPSYAEIKAEHFPDRKPEDIKPKTDEMFAEGEEVASKLRNSTEPYNEFFMQDAEGADVTTQLISDSASTAMVIINQLGSDQLTMEKWNAILDVMKRIDAAGIDYFVVSGGSPDILKLMKQASKLEFNYYVSDGEVLHKIIKENTGIVMIKNGSVTKKYAEGALPADDSFLTQ